MKVVGPSRTTASGLYGLLHAESLSCGDVVAGIVIGSVAMVDRNHEHSRYHESNLCAWSGQTTV
jgi:hypothetical protein